MREIECGAQWKSPVCIYQHGCYVFVFLAVYRKPGQISKDLDYFVNRIYFGMGNCLVCQGRTVQWEHEEYEKKCVGGNSSQMKIACSGCAVSQGVQLVRVCSQSVKVCS